ncbi:MAG: AAA family ATPase [Muribaculaceae bacterium]|nr:AAA family ATPase [Muribaculaceae bacterium]
MSGTSVLAELQRQRRLLVTEQEHERQEYARQAEQWGVERCVARGIAWYPVSSGHAHYNSLNQLVIEVTRPMDGTDAPEDEDDQQFEPGRQVAFFHVSGNGEVSYHKPRATVNYVHGNAMVLAIDHEAATLLSNNDGRMGLQLMVDETTHRLMLEAIDRVMAARGDRLAYLRDLFYLKAAPAARFTFAPLRFPWLNTSQEHAVNEVLCAKDVAIVHGPPGTGKTTTLVEAIAETLRRESQVLVCAQSNMAVDWISERLVERGIEVLRVGNPMRVNDKMLSLTYERRFESHPDYPQLWAMRKAIRSLQGKRSRGEGVHQQLDRLRNRANEIELRIHNSIMDNCRVVASTLAGSANRVLDGTKFATLFIDEAAQALEAACWIAIRRCSRVVFAGDHCQLPPTIKSVEALREGLGTTLMERVVGTHPEAVTLLRVQYRMNEAIMRFSSEWFYGGKVEADPSVRNRGILDYDTPVEWIDTGVTADEDEDFQEAVVGATQGRINRGEAVLTIATLEGLVDRIGRHHFMEERLDVGIISPYRAQVKYLRQLLKRNAALRPLRSRITVNTVDGFQGQERDIIVVSLVRSNEQGQIGFLRDLRRMNVAMTRARMKLIVLGNADTLRRHAFYRRLHDYIQSLKN